MVLTYRVVQESFLALTGTAQNTGFTKSDRLTGLQMWIAAIKLSQSLLNLVTTQNVWVNDLLWHWIILDIPSPLSTSSSFSWQEYQVTSAILQPGTSHTCFTAVCQSNTFPHCSCWPIFSTSRLRWTLQSLSCPILLTPLHLGLLPSLGTDSY